MKHFLIGVLCTLCGLASTVGLAVAGDNNGPKYGGGDSSASAAQGQLQGQGQAQGQGQLQGQAQGNFNVVAPVQSTSNTNSNRNDNTNLNSNSNRNEANSASFSGSSSKSGAIAGAFSGGNSQNITVTDSGKLDYSGSYTVKNVPNVSMGSVYPTAPCMGSTQGSGSGIGFGIGFGTSWTDKDCSIRETARSFAAMGLNVDALKVLCSSEFSVAAPSCASVQPLPAAKPVTMSSTQTSACYADEVVARRMGKPVCQ